MSWGSTSTEAEARARCIERDMGQRCATVPGVLIPGTEWYIGRVDCSAGWSLDEGKGTAVARR